MPNRSFEHARLPVIMGIQNGTRCLASPAAPQPTLRLEVTAGDTVGTPWGRGHRGAGGTTGMGIAWGCHGDGDIVGMG